MSMALHVELQTLSGQELKFEVEENALADSVKRRLHCDSYLQVLPQYQQILCGHCNEFLSSQRLAAHGDGVTFTGTVLVSMGRVLQDLTRRDASAKWQALGVLAAPGIRGTEEAVTAVGMLIEDDDAELRHRAVEVLRSWGDHHAIAEVTARLEHDRRGVRQAAVSALCRTAEQDDEQLVSAVLARLQHSSAFVRQTAVEALHVVCRRDNKLVLDAVCKLLDDQHSGVQRAAAEVVLQSVRKNVEKNSKSSIVAAILHITSPQEFTRRRAVGVLSSLRDDEHAIALAADFQKRRADYAASFANVTASMVALDWLVGTAWTLAVDALGEVIQNGTLTVARDAARIVIDILAAENVSLEQGGEVSVRAAVLCLDVSYSPLVARYCRTRLTLASLAKRASDMLQRMKGNARAIAAISGWFAHDKECFRVCALEAFHLVVEQGDASAINTVLGQLSAKSARVKVAAVVALRSFARGDAKVVSAMTDLLQDPVAEVRCAVAGMILEERMGICACSIAAALICLSDVAKAGHEDLAREVCLGIPKGHCSAISSVLEVLKFQIPEVRRKAIDLLSDITDVDSESVITMTCALLEHPDAGVEASAAEALQRITTQGSAFAKAEIMLRLEHPACHVRTAGVDALRRVSGRGDDQAISAISALTNDPDGDVRRAAATTILAQVPGRGDARAIAAACACLADPEASIRAAAVIAMSELVDRGDADAIAAVTELLRHPEPYVRVAAVQSLQAAADINDREIIASVCRLLTDLSPDVRRTCLHILPDLASAGNEFVMNEVATSMEDLDPFVRCLAIETLAQVSELGDPQTIFNISKKLEDRSSDVRLTAVEVLISMSKDGAAAKAGVAGAAGMALESEFLGARRAAESVLGHIA